MRATMPGVLLNFLSSIPSFFLPFALSTFCSYVPVWLASFLSPLSIYGCLYVCICTGVVLSKLLERKKLNLGGEKCGKTDKCMDVSQILGARPGAPLPSRYTHVSI